MIFRQGTSCYDNVSEKQCFNFGFIGNKICYIKYISYDIYIIWYTGLFQAGASFCTGNAIFGPILLRIYTLFGVLLQALNAVLYQNIMYGRVGKDWFRYCQSLFKARAKCNCLLLTILSLGRQREGARENQFESCESTSGPLRQLTPPPTTSHIALTTSDACSEGK